MNRLYIINFINQSWFKQIIEFLNEQESFCRLLPIVAFDEYPNGFNKNPLESNDDAPQNIFETILYGLALAGCDVDYGKAQYLLITDFFRKCDMYIENMDIPSYIQPEKIPIYKALINKLLEHNILVEDLEYSEPHMEIISSVQGMTESTVTLLHLLYDDVYSPRCLPYGDKQFKRGMCMFYGLESPTREQLVEITNRWGNKKVGLMFIVQYAHYSDYVDPVSREPNDIGETTTFVG